MDLSRSWLATLNSLSSCCAFITSCSIMQRTVSKRGKRAAASCVDAAQSDGNQRRHEIDVEHETE